MPGSKVFGGADDGSISHRGAVVLRPSLRGDGRARSLCHRVGAMPRRGTLGRLRLNPIAQALRRTVAAPYLNGPASPIF